MTKSSIFERLCAHRTVGRAPHAEIAWIASHGALRHLEPGAVLSPQNQPVDGVHIVLSGRLAIYVDRGSGRRKTMEWNAGDVTGLMPYSRLVNPPGDSIAEEPADIVTVYRSDMPEMIRECPEVTAILVHLMLDRARQFTFNDLHDEKLRSLGKLSAGLAHELNNPASAIARSAASLSEALHKADLASRALASARLNPDQLIVIDRVRGICLDSAQPLLSPLEQEDRENSIEDWLRDHKARTEVAADLADTGVTFEVLNQLAHSMEGESLNAAVQWIAARCATRHLTKEIQEAASRIYDLVGAVKGFTQMDRATVPEPVDIAQGLSNTLVVLRSKAKGKSATMSLNLEKDLPRVNGFAGELNQVWANLIDNALDAAGDGGRIEVSASTHCDSVVVRVVDNGSGIPAEIRNRIFDPFFTTKPVGKGTGLGLDIVRRLVQRNQGQIDVESSPGKTEFRVTLPVAGALG